MNRIREIWVPLAAATVGAALVLFDGTVVTVALPSMQRDLDLSLADQEWVVQAYLLAPIALLPLGGALADKVGRKAVFSAGLTLFAAASAICALAGDGTTLIAGRALQGAGAGLTLPASLGLLAMAGQRRYERRRAVTFWTVWSATATAVGPVVGGMIAGGPGWRWIFWLSLAGAGVVLATAVRYVRESRDPMAIPLRWRHAPLLVVAAGGMALGLSAIDTTGLVDSSVLVPAGIGLLAGAVFVVLERRSDSPLVPPVMFSHPAFTMANLLTATVYGALFGAMFVISLFLQQAHRLTPEEAGFALLPLALGLTIGLPFGEWLMRRLTTRLPVAVGCAVAGIALMGIALTPPDTARIVVAAALAGFGLGASAGPLMLVVVDTVELRRASVATGVNSAVARTAAIAAIAGLGVIASIAFDNEFAQGAASRAAEREVEGRVFAAPRRLERSGFPEEEVELARSAAESSFRLAMGVASLVMLGSAVLAVFGLSTPDIYETGEMPLSVAPTPLAVALQRRIAAPPIRVRKRRAGAREPPEK